MNELVLSPVMREDITAICLLERASFTVPWSREDFLACVGKDNCIFTKASINGTLTGYIAAGFAADEGDILSIAVSNKFRRLGIGRSLLQNTLSLLSLHGVNSIYLDVRESNTAAIALYKSQNFITLSKRVGYYSKPKEDALIMRLIIKDENFQVNNADFRD